MGKVKTPDFLIQTIKDLRIKGHSLPEICRETKLGYGTVFRYLRETPIDCEYIPLWRQRQGGSRRRMSLEIEKTKSWSDKIFTSLSYKEKLVFISALYWAEGAKASLDFMNSDSKMISIFMKGMKELFDLPLTRFRVSIRIFEDLNLDHCLDFWSNITEVPISAFAGVEVKNGHKDGKLQYGMCRIRVTKGSFILKQLRASWNVIAGLF